MSTEPHQPTDAVRDIIARSHPGDYDGHTEFGRMTPAERLAWLEAAIVLIETQHQTAGQSWAVAEERPEPPARS